MNKIKLERLPKIKLSSMAERLYRLATIGAGTLARTSFFVRGVELMGIAEPCYNAPVQLRQYLRVLDREGLTEIIAAKCGLEAPNA